MVFPVILYEIHSMKHGGQFKQVIEADPLGLDTACIYSYI